MKIVLVSKCSLDIEHMLNLKCEFWYLPQRALLARVGSQFISLIYFDISKTISILLGDMRCTNLPRIWTFCEVLSSHSSSYKIKSQRNVNILYIIIKIWKSIQIVTVMSTCILLDSALKFVRKHNHSLCVNAIPESVHALAKRLCGTRSHTHKMVLTSPPTK